MKKETIIRTVVLIIALVNQVLVMFGITPLPIAEEELYSLFTVLFTIIASVWTWWKNNSFTKKAQEADKYLENLRKEV